MNFILGIVIGFIAGAFTPSLGRKIKALFVKQTVAAKDAALKSL